MHLEDGLKPRHSGSKSTGSHSVVRVYSCRALNEVSVADPGDKANVTQTNMGILMV